MLVDLNYKSSVCGMVTGAVHLICSSSYVTSFIPSTASHNYSCYDLIDRLQVLLYMRICISPSSPQLKIGLFVQIQADGVDRTEVGRWFGRTVLQPKTVYLFFIEKSANV